MISAHSNRLGIGHILGGGVRCQADTSTVRADLGRYCPGNRGQKTNPLLDRTAITIRAMVRCGLEKLVNQIAIAAVNLDTIETGLRGQAAGAPEVVDDPAISLVSKARGVSAGVILGRPLLSMAQTLLRVRIADGATGARPSG